MKQIIQPEQSTQLSFRHYPVLCAFFREYELFELFDSLLLKKRHHEVSHAQCILLFVCDCLTARTPLYRYTDLLANLDVEMIFGPGARAEQFNEYTMGETLDAIAKFGEDRLFARVLESEETGAPGSLFIADSSFYTKDNISSFGGTWISLVPEKLKEVQRCLAMEGLPFVDSASEGYRVHGFDSCYPAT
jgi:hypothetical protein